MDAQAFLLQLLTGLSRAAILFIVASGLSLVFGAMRIVNIAHGSFYMVGAFVSVTVTAWLGGLLGFLASLVAAAVVVALLAALVEVLALRRLYESEHLMQLLATFAFVLIFADGVQFLWGERPRSVPQPAIIGGAVDLGGIIFPKYSLFLIAVAVVLAVALWALMARTGLGRDIRAAVSDPEMLGMVGVNVPLLFTVVFALGGVLAGLGGVLAAPQSSARLGMDIAIIVESFAVVIIGGLGSLQGTAVGALMVGIAFAFGIVFAPQAALAIVFVVMAAVLVWRPYGLFGVPER
ncbi:MAG: branched-chain amino acid ABC transporter permease [Actinobacteria bacterium]|nr:branched-chain amino acid ABC transporter permease [Actinomycetota bacterium]